MVEVLLPRTGTGVMVELVVTVVVAPVLLWAIRGHRETRLVVAGVLMMWVALMGLRTVH